MKLKKIVTVIVVALPVIAFMGAVAWTNWMSRQIRSLPVIIVPECDAEITP